MKEWAAVALVFLISGTAGFIWKHKASMMLNETLFIYLM